MPFEIIPAPETVPEHFRAFVEGSSPEDYPRLLSATGNLYEAGKVRHSLLIAQFLLGTNPPPIERAFSLYVVFHSKLSLNFDWADLHDAFTELKGGLRAILEQPTAPMSIDLATSLITMMRPLSGWMEDDDGQDLINQIARYVQDGVASR